MTDKVSRTVMLDPQTDKDLADLAYNLKINKQEVIKRLIEKGLDDGILEQDD
jgi:hypothetical protein